MYESRCALLGRTFYETSPDPCVFSAPVCSSLCSERQHKHLVCQTALPGFWVLTLTCLCGWELQVVLERLTRTAEAHWGGMWGAADNISRIILMAVGSEAVPCSASLADADISSFCHDLTGLGMLQTTYRACCVP